ncbi:type IV secretory system conjugative DNA transfer family protein [Yoonia sp. I 8.24]|uniref:type IV secretory system conjugative DNA transfer family protein n=1 Tax=Yoonia sp. I 8.24 TaxID=1537229 RepID=UPI001EDE4F43|nr:type IV secretion system DNA-binding domain-containing protein [Yoonia sp. I 8.24]MCG3267135.1 ATP-binding protein [Yoonia sp. I 8.24]
MLERQIQLLSYDQYISAITAAPRLTAKLFDTEQDMPSELGRLGNPVEDKIAARIIEKKSGYNPSADWKKADKIKEAQHKLQMQYDPMTLDLVRAYNPNLHTKDRAGYLEYLNMRDPKLIHALLHDLSVTPMIDELRRHTYITGGSGSGKTELLKQLIHAAFQREGEATVVIDPHGDLALQVARWQMFEMDDRLVYIDPYLSDDHIPPFNPLIVPQGTTMQQKEVIAQQLVNAFEQLLKGSGGDSLTVNMRTVLMPCLLTLIDRPGSTLADLQRFMNDNLNAELIELGKKSKRRAIRDFFAYDFVGDPSLRPSKSAISRKLQSLFNTLAFDEMVNSQVTLDLEGAINEGKIILFNLSKGRLGDEASEAFGRLVVASIQGLALRRADTPEAERVPINLYIDECQNYIAPATMQILEEARKYGVSLTLAQQVVGRGMSSEMQAVVLNNTNIKVAGRTPEDDKMAKILGKTQADVQNLHTGQFWMKIGNGHTFLLQGGRELLGDSMAMSDDYWHMTLLEQLASYRFLEEDDFAEPETSEAEDAQDDGSPMPWG